MHGKLHRQLSHVSLQGKCVNTSAIISDVASVYIAPRLIFPPAPEHMVQSCRGECSEAGQTPSK